jgi:hypothetical protein
MPLHCCRQGRYSCIIETQGGPHENHQQVWQAFVGIGRHFVRTLDHMSWPAIVGMCIVLALFLTILPLAITLFIGVLIAKLAINAFGDKKQHG